MKPGDKLIIYHTGDQKSAVGTASVVSVDNSDPKNPAVELKAGKVARKTHHAERNQIQKDFHRFATRQNRPTLRRSPH